MKINKLMLAIIAVLGIETIANATPGYCVVTKGAVFNPVPALVANSPKDKIVLVKKASKKGNYFVDTKGNQYSKNEVGYLQYKQDPVGIFNPCNCKNAPTDAMKAVCNYKGHGTANRDRVKSYLSGLTQFKAAKPAEEFIAPTEEEEVASEEGEIEAEEEQY